MSALFRSEFSTQYLLGYSNDNCVAIDFGSEKVLITDGRYYEEAKLKGGFEVIESRDLVKAVLSVLRKNRVKKIVIDSSEWNAEEFLKLTMGGSIFWQKKPHFAQKIRAIKSEEEIQKIDFACSFGKKAFAKLADKLQLNVSEKKVAFDMTLLMNNYGDQDTSFEPIAAFNANASLPHHKPCHEKLKKNSSILVDAGCKIDGYCSDMTRTAFFNGDKLDFNYKQNFKDPLWQKAYDAVLKAHNVAIKSAKVGMKASELDKIARDVINKAGFEKAFKHGLGHGVGLEIHESPSISFRSNEILQEGMVFTIEPGIYLDGIFGVRIEDVVVLKSDGACILGK